MPSSIASPSPRSARGLFPSSPPPSRITITPGFSIHGSDSLSQVDFYRSDSLSQVDFYRNLFSDSLSQVSDSLSQVNFYRNLFGELL
jgi:hypothetical protein